MNRLPHPISAPCRLLRTLFLLPLLLGPLASAAGRTPETEPCDYNHRFARPLGEVLRTLEARFGIRIDCRGFDADTLRLPYADSRLRPYSLEESLDNIVRSLDLKWSHRDGVKYRIEPYEYYRRTYADGERLLAWLSGLCDDRAAWERRREQLLGEARAMLDMQPLYDSLVAAPRVQLGPLRKYDGYTVQTYALETLPGVMVCGAVYAPAGKVRGKRPLIVSPAGHWPEGRMRPDQQYRMATFARMGAVAVDLDIVGWGAGARTVPFPHEDPRSMRLQALWSKAVTDWVVATRTDVDTTRMAATGGSGGATHTLLLALQDARFTVLAPVVHLVAHFDGGCPCESGVPVTTVGGGSCTTELLAAVAAPRPLLTVSDGGDWTTTYPASEYPFLRRIWDFYGAGERVENAHFPDQRHDYGPDKRQAVYDFFARTLGLDASRADESKVTLLPAAALELLGTDGE